jgi:hypothetical protein
MSSAAIYSRILHGHSRGQFYVDQDRFLEQIHVRICRNDRAENEFYNGD